MDELKLPTYETPQIVTFSDAEILEQLGPAQTLYPGGNSGSPSW